MSTRNAPVIKPLHHTELSPAIRHVFVRDLVVSARVGVYDHERANPQRVRINLDLSVREATGPLDDCLDNVLCYEQIIVKVRSIAHDGHVNLVETMAERIAAICLQDRRVASVRVRVEKLDVFADAASVGVEIERTSIFS
ncbi:dihydroneopterin aldolase [Phaeovibrio sulfidiphilus]|uniref:7,8-dihydroneopterin aldolase n=1 Tax=Phaeovibrio sulfidiphilus TaxID=1220600 RepID=A0A8J6YP23_9PROT|nr:dihydroneopterin aldolase [Phaeovibrio sulfidiphilus]